MLNTDGTAIQYENVHVGYEGRDVLDGLDLSVHQGELLALVGPSGCGKTTTLKLVNRLLEPRSGTIRVAWHDAPTSAKTSTEAPALTDVTQIDPILLRRKIGYVFQRFGLFPHLSVAQNIAMVPTLLRWTEDAIRRRTSDLLELVQLPREVLDRAPSTLSGGQQQRVSLARALAARPRIVLMDEPFGALDPVTRDGLRDEYARLRKQLGLTTILVTHDMGEALMLADRVAVLRTGKIVRIDDPASLLRHPDDPFVERLLDAPRRQLEALDELRSQSPNTPQPTRALEP